MDPEYRHLVDALKEELRVRERESRLACVVPKYRWMLDKATSLRPCRTCEAAGASVRRLERQRAEARERVGLFEGLPLPCQAEWFTDGREDEESFVVQKDRDGACRLLVIDPLDPHSKLKLKTGTLAECLSALRTELQESGDE